MSLILDRNRTRNRESQSDTLDEAAIIRNRNAAISSLRAQYPRLDFSSARDQVRQSSPELFGLPAHGETPAVSDVQVARNRAESLLAIKSPRALAVESHMEKHHVSHEIAWNAVRRSRPEFWEERGDPSAAFVVNRGSAGQPDDATMAGQIADAIDRVRERNRALSYGEARNIARREMPEVFGVEK